MRIYIDSINSYLGRELCEQLYNFEELESNKIFGTLIKSWQNQESGVLNSADIKHKNVWRVVEPWPFKKKLKTLFSCSLVIYDLHTTDIIELESVLREIKLQKRDKPTILILVSSIMVWARNVNEYVLIDEDEKKSESGYEKVESEMSLSENQSTPKYTQNESTRKPFNSDDYRKRLCYPKYDRWKYLESLVLSLGQLENLHTYVIGSGILYGNGENILHSYFKSAWLSKKDFRIIGPGTNLIPMVHIKDLVGLIKTISLQGVEQRYHLAVDKSITTQNDLLQAIRSHFGGDYQIPHIDVESIHSFNYQDLMSVDLFMECSYLMNENKFNWHCVEGLVKNIRRITEEYCEIRELHPINIVVLGPPGSGKTHFSSLLAEHYNLEHIKVTEFMNENREEFIRQITTADDEGVKDGQDSPKLLDWVKHTLIKNPICFYRGYVLDGYPRTFNEANKIFLKPKLDSEKLKLESDNESEEYKSVDQEVTEYTQNSFSNVYPKHLIYLKCSEEYSKKKLIEIPHKQRITGYNDETGFIARNKIYQDFTELNYETNTLTTFFQDYEIESLEVDVENNTSEDAFVCMRIFIEREGRPYNFLKNEAELIIEKQYKLEKEEEAERMLENDELEKIRIENEEKKKRVALQHAKRLEIIEENERCVLEARSMPLRQYLMKYVMPTLSEGLLQMCKTHPDDPIDFLADYLLAHAEDHTGSEDVPFNSLS